MSNFRAKGDLVRKNSPTKRPRTAMAQKVCSQDEVCQHDTFPFQDSGTSNSAQHASERTGFFFSLLFFARLRADVGGLYPPHETFLSLHHVPIVALTDGEESIPLG